MKLTLTICVSIVLATMSTINVGGQTPMLVTYDQPSQLIPSKHRSPIPPIKFNQDGHQLTFAPNYVGAIVELYENDALLYVSEISDNGSFYIPDGFVGEVELIITKDGNINHVIIEL